MTCQSILPAVANLTNTGLRPVRPALPWVRRSRRWLVVCWVLAAGLSMRGQEPIATLRAGTRLVVVDVQVRDAKGAAVTGLGKQDFQLSEDGTPQNVRSLEEHTSAPPQAIAGAPAMPALPPGTFTDYDPVPTGDTLTVFLLDELNTPVKDQSYAIAQLQQFAAHAPAGTRIAIFGLRSRLYLLNGFTADPAALREALAHRVLPSSSLLLEEAAGTPGGAVTQSELAAAGTPPVPGSTSPDLLVSTLQQFEADNQAFQAELRVQYTLDALGQLARYLDGFHGRKNLFWFSAAFPVNLLPDPSLANPFVGARNNDDEFKATVGLLARAQVAVYPVDARGLMTVPLYDASQSGRGFAATPNAVSAQLNKFYSSQAMEHQAMDALASGTGGRAFYNTNGLADAVSRGMREGAEYYTLSYAPAKRDAHGEYRKLGVKLTGALAASGYRLVYRPGYVAEASQEAQAVPETARQPTGASKYERLAVSHGAPAPHDLIFNLSVKRHTAGTEAEPAAGNQLSAGVKGPYRQYEVEFSALPSQVQLMPEGAGNFSAELEFSAFIFGAGGDLLNAAGSKVHLHLTPEATKRFLADALRFHLEISAPVQTGAFLRVAVEDRTATRFGVIEIPLAAVAKLPVQP